MADIPQIFRRLSGFNELQRLHTVINGISPADNSVYVVSENQLNYQDVIMNSGMTIRYVRSNRDIAANNWLNSRIGQTVNVVFNPKYNRQYYDCGRYLVGHQIGNHWILSRVGDRI